MITDPPYDERTHKGAKTTASESGMADIDFAHLANLDFVRDLLRVSRGWVICFCALEQLGAYQAAAGKRWVRAGVWNREAGSAFARPDRPFQGAEGIAIMSAAKVKVFPAGAKRAVWTSTTERADRVHPTQKPIGLMLELIQDFTLPGQSILDPFAGSGTTLVAAMRMGRTALGYEENERHWRGASARVEAEERGLTLQASRAGQTSIFDRIT